jgi:hypothetical protein
MSTSASQGQWAPWSDDPDPPVKPLSQAELKRFGEGMKRLLEKKKLRKRNPVPPPEEPQPR